MLSVLLMSALVSTALPDSTTLDWYQVAKVCSVSRSFGKYLTPKNRERSERSHAKRPGLRARSHVRFYGGRWLELLLGFGDERLGIL